MKHTEVQLMAVTTKNVETLLKSDKMLNDALKDGWQILSVNTVPAWKYDLIYTLVR